MIYVKSLFGGWREVDKQGARRFVDFLMANIPAVKEKDKTDYINSERLRGITVEELGIESEVNHGQATNI